MVIRRMEGIAYIRDMMLRRSFFLLILFIPALFCRAQEVLNLQEDHAQESNGLQYSYSISNESSKEVKGEDYERYEISLMVTNTSGCLRLIPFRSGWTGTISSGRDDASVLAEFNCTNATGKRLTAKKGAVYAKPYYANARIPDEYVRDRYRTVTAQIGYAIRPGESLDSHIVVIVPKGERPVFNCRTVYFPEMN